MKFRAWLDQRPHIILADISRELGFDYHHLHRVASGTITPGKHLCAAIHHLTDGEVTVDDLIDYKKLKVQAIERIEKKRLSLIKVCERIK